MQNHSGAMAATVLIFSVPLLAIFLWVLIVGLVVTTKTDCVDTFYVLSAHGNSVMYCSAGMIPELTTPTGAEVAKQQEQTYLLRCRCPEIPVEEK